MLHSYPAARAFLFERWYLLPSLSAALLILSFHPFNFWFLSFIALAPLYFFVAAFPERSWRGVFLGGFLTGAAFALSLSYFTVIQFQWLPETYLFNTLVRISFIPIALAGGLLAGSAMALYRFLRSSSALLNTLAGAAVYTGSEMLLWALCGGYYFAMLSYAGASVPPLVALAPVGGAFFVSFAMAWFSVSVAEAASARYTRAQLVRAFALPLVCFAVLGGTHGYYLRAGNSNTIALDVAAVQAASKVGIEFGTEKNGEFSAPGMERLLREAAEGAPDLLIYPFSPVEGALYDAPKDRLTPDILIATKDAVARFAGAAVPAETTVMVWANAYEDGAFHNDFLFFRGGELVSSYRKRSLFPFIDYTPRWAQRMSFYTTTIDFSAGEGGAITLPKTQASGLLCSEIQRQDFARAESGKAPLIISAGSEALFADELASVFSLKAAQFRAAENNVPVIRSNILGPSALIDRDGSIAALQPRGEEGPLRGTMEVGVGRPTLFSRVGNTPLVVAMGIMLAAALVRKKKYDER